MENAIDGQPSLWQRSPNLRSPVDGSLERSYDRKAMNSADAHCQEFGLIVSAHPQPVAMHRNGNDRICISQGVRQNAKLLRERISPRPFPLELELVDSGPDPSTKRVYRAQGLDFRWQKSAFALTWIGHSAARTSWHRDWSDGDNATIANPVAATPTPCADWDIKRINSGGRKSVDEIMNGHARLRHGELLTG